MTEAGSGTENGAESELFDLLADEYARTILVAASREPMSARTLSERYDMSLPTVYRRVERLEAFDALIERTELDPSGGHHRSIYETNLEHIDIDFDDGELRVELRLREDAVDRLARMWRELRGE